MTENYMNGISIALWWRQEIPSDRVPY